MNETKKKTASQSLWKLGEKNENFSVGLFIYAIYSTKII